MKCSRCGAEIKDGYLYCSVCGYESKIEADMTTFEDEYFQTILKGESEESSSSVRKVIKGSRLAGKNRKNLIIFSCCIVIGLLILTGLVFYTLHKKNEGSYEYQIEKAKQMVSEGRYDDALTYYGNALSIKPDDEDVRFAMAGLYEANSDYDAALVMYMDIISLDSNNEEAYRALIAVYDKKEDYDSIKSLMESADESLMPLFADYIVDAPTLSPSVGEYNEYIDVVPFSNEGYDIYYTTDGTDPTKGDGILYTSGSQIELYENGVYEIRAACKNAKGIFSDISNGVYEIEVLPPKYAVVEPDGGHVTSDTLAVISAESGCSIYYTWDGTDPTTESEQYFEPLVIPDGNNVLSVLVVNNTTGLASDIYRTNFIVD
jgi:tetratricopeptide (TPR) repeat protein